MTTVCEDIATIQAELREYAGELRRLANEIERMVPEDCSRDDLMLAAFNRAGGASEECRRAHRDFTWAIQREKMEGSDG